MAEMRGGEAVLINRTKFSFNGLKTGCVVEDEGVVRVVGELFGHLVFDAVWSPKARVSNVLWMINDIESHVANQERMGRTDLIKRCPAGSRTALIRAGLTGAHEWSAAGTPWPR